MPAPSDGRSTADFVIRLLAVSVSVLILASGLSLIIVGALHPDYDTGEAVRGISDLINTIVGALIGYLAGRAPGGRAERKDETDGSR